MKARIPSPPLSSALALVPASVLLVALGACVPPGNSTPSDAGPSPATTASAVHPSVNVMRAPFEDNFDRVAKPKVEDAAAPLATTATADGGVDAGRLDAGRLDAGTDGGADAGRASSDGGAPDGASADESDLGPDWTAVGTNAWKIENGKLCVQNARNHGVWLNRTLPSNARIEFDAVSYSAEGDIKAELWGDGRSAATAVSYTNATSYLAILGGWKNTFHVLARLNEHGTDRKEIHVDPTSDDPRQKPVAQGQTYHFKVERTDGKKVRWSVDGTEMLAYDDAQPLVGVDHDHFGFNNWQVKVCYDNVRITPLP